MSANVAGVELDHELKKFYSKEFAVDKNTLMELSNKYGKIDIKTWNKPAIKIDVSVIIKANNKSNAEDKMREISILMEKKGNNVVVVTDFLASNQSWWSSWWNSTGNIKIEINYDVFMPVDQTSIIENKYGNIYLPDVNAKTSINLQYGTLQAQNINGDLLMDLSYGKATMGSVKNLSATIAYSDLRCTSSGTTTILTTKYSKVYIDDAKTLTANSKYDNYKIGTANVVTMTGSYDDIELGSISTGTFTLKYSGMEISSLSNAITTDISYGSMTIQNLKTSFKKMIVNTSYAPIKVFGTVPCKIDVSGKYFDAQLGADFISQHKVSEGNSKVLKGYKGSDRTGASITITSKYGDVVIR
jgi:hypothetical protein